MLDDACQVGSAHLAILIAIGIARAGIEERGPRSANVALINDAVAIGVAGNDRGWRRGRCR